MSSKKNPSHSTIQLRSVRKTIGKNIRNYRTAKNISLRRLGMKTRISINDLDLFEMGRGKLGIENLAKIAGAMEIELVQLLKITSN